MQRTHPIGVQLDGLNLVPKMCVALRSGETGSLQALQARPERKAAVLHCSKHVVEVMSAQRLHVQYEAIVQRDKHAPKRASSEKTPA